RERELTVESLDAALAPRQVRLEDDLGVAVRAEGDPARLELTPDREVVEDLAVVGDPRPAVGRAHRLRAVRPVHDREPPVPEAHPSLDVDAAVVGSTVSLELVHPLE